MAETIAAERLQPFLLDRITDDAPDQRQESRERRMLSGREYRKAVLRDLRWLMNAASHPEPERLTEYDGICKPVVSLKDYEGVAESVINFGMADFAGTTASSITPRTIEQRVKEAILRFEPRVLKRSLQVTTVQSTTADSSHVVQIEIRGELWNLPLPEMLFIRTEVDLDTGRCQLVDPSHGG